MIPKDYYDRYSAILKKNNKRSKQQLYYNNLTGRRWFENVDKID
jgi:hypothetical protein